MQRLNFWDKHSWEHLVGSAVLTFLLSFVMPIPAVMILVTFLGVFKEIGDDVLGKIRYDRTGKPIIGFDPRGSDLWDIFWNTVGIIAGSIAGLICH